MKILINDLVQNAGAVNIESEKAKTPALADLFNYSAGINPSFDFGSAKTFNCIGIGNTDGTDFTIGGQNITFSKTGLYLLSPAITTQFPILTTSDASFVGRVALGTCREICTSPAKEPGFYSTQQKRITSSGQEIPGAGGISGRKIGVDSRYKIDENILNDFNEAYSSQNGQLFPFFLNFADEFKIPYDYFYGALLSSDITFQGAINKFLYSSRFDFHERF